MEEIKQKIEQWFIDCGYNKPENAEKQYLKIIAEIGEMADALCKEDHENFKSEAGDVFVTIVGYCLQKKEYLSLEYISDENLGYSTDIDMLIYEISTFEFEETLKHLISICHQQNTTLLECATIAYNKIQGRLERGELKIINGTIQK